MTILFLENRKIFSKWSSKTYEYKYNKICDDKRFKVIDIDDNLEDLELDNYNNIIFGWHGIPINKYYNRSKHIYYKKHIHNLETVKQIEKKIKTLLTIKNKSLIVQDMHTHDYYGGLESLSKYLNKYNFNKLITPYNNTKQIQFIREKCPNIHIIWIPHYIDETIFTDRNNKKQFDILLFGNNNKTHYPFRFRVIELLLNNKDIFNIYHIPRIKNYFKFNKNISNENLSNIINKCWMTLCTSSKYDFLLGKYFETSMSGSVIFGNMATDGNDIWDDGYIHIDDGMTDHQIIKTIQYNLVNKERLTITKNKMLHKMKQFHLSNYTTTLYNMINNNKYLIYDNSDRLRSIYLPLKLYIQHGWNVIDINTINKGKYNNIKEYIIDKYNKFPYIIFYWINNNVNHPEDMFFYPKNITILYYVIDIHKSTFNKNKHLLNNVDHYVTPYAYCFNDMIKDNKKNVIWYPFSIPSDCILDINTKPIMKLLLTGSAQKEYYPHRFYIRKLHNRYNSNRHMKKNNPIHILKHPGYNEEFDEKKALIGKNYLKYINTYIASFTCYAKPIFPYIVRKFFEIPACGTLLVANDSYVQKYCKQLGFIDGVNYISTTDDNIEDKIQYIINVKNKDIIDKIRNKGQELILEKHLDKHRVKYITKLCNDL